MINTFDSVYKNQTFVLSLPKELLRQLASVVITPSPPTFSMAQKEVIKLASIDSFTILPINLTSIDLL